MRVKRTVSYWAIKNPFLSNTKQIIAEKYLGKTVKSLINRYSNTIKWKNFKTPQASISWRCILAIRCIKIVITTSTLYASFYCLVSMFSACSNTLLSSAESCFPSSAVCLFLPWFWDSVVVEVGGGVVIGALLSIGSPEAAAPVSKIVID